MIFISAWEAYTNGIGAQLAAAAADDEVWEGNDGSVIIGDFDPEDVTCEYAR
jgi:streptogramin lyase